MCFVHMSHGVAQHLLELWLCDLPLQVCAALVQFIELQPDFLHVSQRLGPRLPVRLTCDLFECWED